MRDCRASNTKGTRHHSSTHISLKKQADQTYIAPDNMGHFQSILVLLLIGCTLVSSADTIPDPAPPPKNTVVELKKKAGTTLMECGVAPPSDSTYTKLEWKIGDSTDATCTVTMDTTQTTVCEPDFGIDDSNKYNIISKKAVDFTYAGKYTCTLSNSADTPKTPAGQLTIAGSPECPDQPISIPVGAKEKISCDIRYAGDATVTLKLTAEGGVDVTGEDMDPADGVKKITASYDVPTTAASAEKTYTCAATVDLKITPYAAEKHGENCEIKVTVYTPVITAKPEAFTYGVVGSPLKIPCTVNKDGVYSKVIWNHPDDNLICTGIKSTTLTEKSECTTTDYTIDDPAPHDLTVKKVVASSLNKKYIAKVENAGTLTGETCDTTLALYKAPTCPGKWEDGKLKLVCQIQYTGTGAPAPTMKWYEGTSDTPLEGTTTSDGPKTDDDYSVKLETILREKVTPKYTCKAHHGDILLGSCEQSGASALHAKFLQSTMLALAIVFMLNYFK